MNELERVREQALLTDEELKVRAIAYFKKEKDMEVLPENMDLGFLKQELEAQLDQILSLIRRKSLGESKT